MMRDEHGPPVPELARRMTVSSCRHDPARALVPVLTAMPAAGIPLGDILADSGYAHRDADAWALPLRQPARSWSRTCTPSTAAPAAPTTAPSSPTATSTARPRPARCWNSGRSPATPPGPGRRPRPADRRDSPGTSSARSPPTTTTATTGCMCPAAMGKIRCPLRPASMTLDRNRPEILTPPAAPAGLLHPPGSPGTLPCRGPLSTVHAPRRRTRRKQAARRCHRCRSSVAVRAPVARRQQYACIRQR